MPPRTGPRRRKRLKPSPPPLLPRHFTIIRSDHTIDPVFVPSVELADGCLVLRNQAGAVEQIIANGQWREIRPTAMAGMADMTLPAEVVRDAPPDEPDGNREQATVPLYPAGLVNENDPVFQPARKEAEAEGRFVPSSPEEAQRILMELHRRIAPDYQDPLEAPADSAAAPPKGAP